MMQVSSRKSYVFQLTATGILIAIGILIPMFSPVKLLIPPASYTLASHVAIFIAMFISPYTTVGVVIGTTLGFFLGGFPLIIVLRAASHIAWALPGAFYLSKIPAFQISWLKLRVFSFTIAVTHGIVESVVVIFFYFGMGFPDDMGIIWVLGFIGLGTVIHSMVDFEIANGVRLVLQLQKSYKALVGYRGK